MVRVQIGDLDGPIGFVTARGKRLRYEGTPAQRRLLYGIVADCREGIDPETGMAYATMPPEQFLRALTHRLHGWTWANIVEDGEDFVEDGDDFDEGGSI